MVKTGTIAAQQAMAALIGLLIMTSILLRKILPKIQFTLNYYSDNRSVQYASICVSNPNDPCTAAVLVVRVSTKPNVSCNGDVINTPDIQSTDSQCMDNDGDIRRFYFPPEPFTVGSLTVQIIVCVTITSIRQLWQVNSTSIWTLNGDQFAGHGDSPDNNRLLILYKDGNRFETLYLYIGSTPNTNTSITCRTQTQHSSYSISWPQPTNICYLDPTEETASTNTASTNTASTNTNEYTKATSKYNVHIISMHFKFHWLNV